MDLLALVSDDGQLGVHRLEWQKLWVACPDTPITALCWRPDGKVLATGHRHGAVSLYNVEACELFRTLRAPLAAPVCHLSWVQGLAPNPATATPTLHLAYRYRHTRFFPAPPPGREHGAGLAGMTTAAAAAASGTAGKASAAAGGSNAGPGGSAAAATLHEWPPPPDSLDVLVTSDGGGGVSMFACGEVMVAALPPRASGGGSGGDARDGGGEAEAAAAAPLRAPLAAVRGELPGKLQAVLSRDLTSLLVVSEPVANGDGASGSGGGFSATAAAAATLSVYGCGKLGSCQAEILELSLLGGLVAGRLKAAQAALAAAARAWKGAASELSKRMDEQLREILESHGHDPDDVLGELTCMLASGHVSPPLQSFLTSTLTEAGLRRLGKMVDMAVQEVSCQLLDGVLPALQLVAFVEYAVAVTEVEAVKALLQTEFLRQLLTRVGCQYRVFFTWLLKILQSLEETRPPGAEGPVPGGPLPGSGSGSGSLADAPICLPTLLAFLEEGGQLSADAVARDLDASQSTLGLPVGSLTFPKHLLPHLKALQEAAFPMPQMEGSLLQEEAAAAGGASSQSGGGGGGSNSCSGGISRWPDKPLQRQLVLLGELCRGAFGRLPEDVSPSVQLLVRMPLLPPPSPRRGPHPRASRGGEDGCSSYLGSGYGICFCMQLPQIRTEPHAGRPALLACTVPAPAPAAAAAGAGAAARELGDGGGGGGGGASGGREALLLMRLTLKQRRTPQASGQRFSRRLGAHACLLTLPHGMRVLGLSYYRAAQLALLLESYTTDPRVGGQGSAGSGGGSGSETGGLLALVPTEGLQMVDVGDIAGGEVVRHLASPSSCASVAQICTARGAVAHWPVPGSRLRGAPGGGSPGAAGSSSSGGGSGAAFTAGSRSLMIDLEEDEEGDEEGEGDEEEEEEHLRTRNVAVRGEQKNEVQTDSDSTKNAVQYGSSSSSSSGSGRRLAGLDPPSSGVLPPSPTQPCPCTRVPS
ncbi:hypothetical protein VOLCADRAFT_86521 [Volvox carteri f. nagariensis]|uniref:Anaphase-promoting complex subunit 4 n=1 Tax=Volvox carteri f. nagariensis TaxID=3068 RepID=D8TIW5_VOLCA|nr:uncharacterized protein VOLCADRAFT_86521 [Volvox carteri f. nagariensis]EFJ52439.1 hypothetical protein VOLCADRAFT_86521 [Volvox carteri f. nagariensis]|eukprot:XP_002946512.1 hypothetical protein VOLCADRAFT_86521 [Volvox carteri f. nagariensis]